MNIKALEFLMEQYGLWVWSDNGTPRGSSPMLALMKRNPANEKRFAAVIPCISDDRALQVDRFLARLYDEDPDAIRSLILYFIPIQHLVVGNDSLANLCLRCCQ